MSEATLTTETKSLSEKLWVFFLACGYSVFLHYFLGMEDFWDTANYHLYIGWAALQPSLYQQGAIAQYHTFLNPILDVINYVMFSIHPFVGAVFHSIIFSLTIMFVYLIADKILEHPKGSRLIQACATIIGASGAMTVSLFGSFTNEHTTALFVMIALWMVLHYWDREKEPKKIIIAGLLVGIAFGLKLTAASSVVGFLLSTAILSKFNLKVMAYFSLGLVVGILGTDGIFMILRWEIYGNPIFPFANNLFQSPYFPVKWKAFSEFSIGKLPYCLSLPIYWLSEGYYSEVITVRDSRFLMAYLGIVMIFISTVFQRKILKKKELFILLFFIFSWLTWILFFRIYRYLIVLELISGILFLMGFSLFFSSFRSVKNRLLPLIVCLIICCTVYPNWGRRPWSNNFFSNNLRETVANRPIEIVFFADERTASLASDLQKANIPFRNLLSQEWYDGDSQRTVIDPQSIKISKETKVYFLHYFKEDIREKGSYLKSLFPLNSYAYKCEELRTNTFSHRNPYLCHFEELVLDRIDVRLE